MLRSQPAKLFLFLEMPVEESANRDAYGPRTSSRVGGANFLFLFLVGREVKGQN